MHFSAFANPKRMIVTIELRPILWTLDGQGNFLQGGKEYMMDSGSLKEGFLAFSWFPSLMCLWT